MARIIQKYDGQVIKSIGDALLFRFPENEIHDAKTIKNVLECCLSMIDSRKDLNDELSSAGLPEPKLQDQLDVRFCKGCAECHIQHI